MTTKPREGSKPFHYVEIDDALCNGCVLCMKACPTKAIRVKDHQTARIEGFCIDCGECVRVCPRKAITAITTESYEPKENPYSTISVSPVLFTQFGENVMPNDVLLAIRRMGFRYVHDQSYTNEMINHAIELYIEENRKKRESPWPLISAVCPVVVRLVAYRFPSLLKHIIPLDTPREIVAREAKKRLSMKYGCSQEEVKVFYITPCLAKMISIKEPLLRNNSYLDGAIGIGNIYESVKKNILELDEDKVLHHSGGVGLGWAMSGGEVAGLEMECLAVSGLQETIRYLEKIEMGLLHGIDYVEFRVCAEGCLGGPLTVADKYQAKHHLQRLVRMFGVEKRVKGEYVRRLYEKGWFFTDKKGDSLVSESPTLSIANGIKRQNSIEETLQLLPRKECGLCGAPDCRAFAEDVVDGKASLESCIFFVEKRKKGSA
jgi:iron only hydrogenase large subunit-like protein